MKTILLILIACAITNGLFAQGTIVSAYQAKDTIALKAIIGRYKMQLDQLKDNKEVSALMTVFYSHFEAYLLDNKKGSNADYQQRYLINNNQILQPKIAICYTDQINLDNIREDKRKLLNDNSFSDWGFYNFDTIFGLRNCFYSIKDPEKFRIVPNIVNGDFKTMVNNFLAVTGFLTKDDKTEHNSRAAFLKKKINLKVVSSQEKGTINQYSFNYPFEIERIVFDKKNEKAVVQAIIDGNHSVEYYYQKENEKWVLAGEKELIVFG